MYSSTFFVLEEFDLFEPLFCLSLGPVRPAQVLAFLRKHTVTAGDLFNHAYHTDFAMAGWDLANLAKWKMESHKLSTRGVSFKYGSYLTGCLAIL